MKRFGYSLIELVVVIGIISILSVVTLSSYSKYTTRTKIASVIPSIEIYQTKVVQYFMHYGNWPYGGVATIGGPVGPTTILGSVVNQMSTSPNAAATQIANGLVHGGTADYSGDFYISLSLNSSELTALPTSVTAPILLFVANENGNGVITWTCTTAVDDVSADIPADLLPPGCVHP